MDPSAWIALAGLAFLVVTALLTLIAKAAWTVSSTVTAIRGDVSAVKLNVRLNGENLTALDEKLTESLENHELICDPHRQALDERIAKLEGA